MSIFSLPDLGEGLPDAEINEWYVKEGDTVTLDQPLVAMETAKAVVDVPSPQAGTIKKLYGQAGDIIITGNPLIEFESIASQQPETKEQKSGDAGTVVGNIEESGQTVEDNFIVSSHQHARPKATPAVRAFARRHQIDLNSVQGNGEYGLITRKDIEKAAQLKPTMTAPTSSTPEGFKPIRGVRRAMVQSMTLSHQQVVPVTLFDDADIHAWAPGTDITARLIQAVCYACSQEPALNAWFDGNSSSIKQYSDVHLGLAMDTKEGLFVPVIKRAQSLEASAIREKINEYKQSVNSRQVAQDDLQGNTITLSNFGNFAGKYASPIIVPPTVAIIGVGRLREEVVAFNGKAECHKVIPLSLSFDHRACTGGEATRFLGAMIEALQAP